MNQVVAFLFVMVVLGILAYAGHQLREWHLARYGRCCWILTMGTISELFDEMNDSFHHEIIRTQSKRDLKTLEAFTYSYKGEVDLDKVVPSFDVECPFFQALKERIALNWHFNESPLMKILDSAIYAYNVDADYHISPRQFVEYLGYQFEYYFITRL